MRKLLDGVDTIVFPGGGINSLRFCKAAKYILDINENAEVYFNANGIAVKHSSELRTQIIEILNNPRVVSFTTRGDYITAKECVITEKKYPVKLILDPAIWASEVYGVKKDINSEIIGIGIIRAEIFKENGCDISVDEVTEIYKGLFKELDKRNIKWQVFCNGTKKDYNYARNVLKLLHYDTTVQLAPRPIRPKELVELIARYKGIIAARFHANIIATSLDIPSIAIVWNHKMDGFGELIGCKKRYIDTKDILMDSKEVVNKMLEAINEGYKSVIKKEKKRTLNVMKNIIR